MRGLFGFFLAVIIIMIVIVLVAFVFLALVSGSSVGDGVSEAFTSMGKAFKNLWDFSFYNTSA